MDGSSSVAKKIGVIVLSVLLIGGVAFYLLSMRQSKVADTFTTSSISPTNGVNEIAMSNEVQKSLFRLASDNSSSGNITSVSLIGNSYSNAVTGFDIVVQYNSAKLAYSTYVPTIPGYQVIVNKKTPGLLILTAVKNLNNNQPTMFNNEKVLSLQFTSRSKGANTISILDKMERNRTKIVNEKSEIIFQDSPQALNLSTM